MSAITAQHKAIRQFYADRKALEKQHVTHELAVREPFKKLLETLGKANRWTLVVEQKIEGLAWRAIPDGTLRDDLNLPRGYWEAKDTRDDLDAEIQKKFARGYPKTNIIFEDTRRAVLYQRGERAGDYDLNQPEQIATLLERFFGYTEPNIVGFEQAMATFQQHTPELARGLLALIEEAHKDNRAFQTAYAEFMDICKNALNPNISREAVDEMLIQHLLTERLMRTVFDNPDFAQRNAIAVEVEKVIKALTSRSFSRRDFLGQLDYFYEAIEAAARDLTDFKDKQTFINTVYERFFQGYAVKVADTHGIVYTPQPIVDFMCAAVEEVLRDEFGLGLDDPDVCIIDPCTGTGNFILNLMRRLNERNPAALPDLYAQRMFANEVMLLPYYIASLNIEHAYYEMTGRYEPFEGLCFVDTLDLAEGAQMKLAFMTERNSARVERQKQAKITVVIGNPPYNVGQLNENDNNKNRKYDVIDRRVSETYARDSNATNKNALSDAYVKFFRWATDRLEGRDGVVCFVSNNSFIDNYAFDGMRKHLAQDFNRIHLIDLKGNVRKDSMREGIPIGPEHTVFGLAAMVGISISVFVRNSRHADHRISYSGVDWRATRQDKFELLERAVSLDGIRADELKPDNKYTWLTDENAAEYESLIPLGTKSAKAAKSAEVETIFKIYGRGIATTRDEVAYDFERERLIQEVVSFIEIFNSEVDRYKRAGRPKDVDHFVDYKIKWSRDLKRDLVRGNYAEYSESKVRTSHYRPFCRKYLFFDRILNEEVYVFPHIYPTRAAERENLVLVVSDIAYRATMFSTLIADSIPDLHLCATSDSHQCFPFYVYDEDGSNRRENITDWALAQFRAAYGDETITKWDIFYYVYGLLHHPAYRERYADNLKRELPRIPLAGVEAQTDLSPIEAFRAFAEAGRKLAELHLGYEDIEPYSLKYDWKPGKPISWRVEKMRLSKDKTAIQVNDSLTLRGIPAAAFDYRLGNRSALDWIIDQYRVKTDKRSGITSDPNRYSEDEQYIVELVGRVARVSVETVAIVKGLPELRFGEGEA